MALSDDARRQLDEAIAGLEPDLQNAFFQSVWQIRDAAEVSVLLAYLKAGDVAAALAYIFDSPEIWDDLTNQTQQAVADAAYGDLALKFHDALEAAHHGAGVSPLTDFIRPEDHFVTPPPDVSALRVRFPDPRYAAHVDSEIGKLIVQIDDTTREGVRQYLEASLAAGRNPLDTITELVGRVQADGSRVGGIIGLTDQQAQAVLNYRTALENRSSDALNRALRDRRFDASVGRNVASNPNFTPLSAEQIDNLTTRYEGRMLAYRAETIARTEAMRAQRLGQRMAWQAAIDDGKVAGHELQRTWYTMRDGKVRPAHQEMEGVTVGFDEFFNTPDEGPILDPSAPNCRCLVWVQPALIPTT